MKRLPIAPSLAVLVALSLLAPAAARGQAATAAPKAATDLSLEAAVDALFRPWSGLATPGAAVAVVKDGLVVYRKGFGCAQLEYGVPITPATVFHVASVSKQFTAMAITMLEAEGKLSADDDVRRWLPDLPDFGPPVTVRHLLHHVGGMRDQWELLLMSGWPLENVITQEHILGLLKRQRELNFPPGKQFLYCNSGYTLLAEVAAKAAGTPFTDWTRDRIFRPLGMTSTHFRLDPREIVPGRAYSYEGDAKSGFRQALLNYGNVGATSLFTTVEDAANWLRNFDEKRVGGPAVLDRLLTKGRLSDGKEIPYARGLMWGEYRGLKTFGHNGADAGFRSDVLYFPGERFGVAVFSNLGSFDPSAVSRKIADLYLADALAPLPAAPASPAAQPSAAPAVAIPAADLAAFTGSWWLASSRQVRKVELRNGSLVYVRSAESASPMAPVAPAEFRLDGADVPVAVKFAKRADRYDTMTVTVQGQPPVVATRFEPWRPGPAALKEYAGTYESPELGTKVEVAATPAGLFLRFANGDAMPLEPLLEERFSAAGGEAMVQAARARNGAVSGIRVSTGRAWNVRFDRVR